MARQRIKKNAKKPIDLQKIGKTLAKLEDTKRRLIRASVDGGDQEFARRAIEKLRIYLQRVREGLELGVREGDLAEFTDLTPEMAQQAIYGCQILEASLRMDPELPQ